MKPTDEPTCAQKFITGFAVAILFIALVWLTISALMASYLHKAVAAGGFDQLGIGRIFLCSNWIQVVISLVVILFIIYGLATKSYGVLWTVLIVLVILCLFTYFAYLK